MRVYEFAALIFDFVAAVIQFAVSGSEFELGVITVVVRVIEFAVSTMRLTPPVIDLETKVDGMNATVRRFDRKSSPDAECAQRTNENSPAIHRWDEMQFILRVRKADD